MPDVLTLNDKEKLSKPEITNTFSFMQDDVSKQLYKTDYSSLTAEQKEKVNNFVTDMQQVAAARTINTVFSGSPSPQKK